VASATSASAIATAPASGPASSRGSVESRPNS